MRLLFIDTETTGLPKDSNAPYTNIDNWPRLVQVSWLIYDDTKDEVTERNFIVKPDGYNIPEESVLVHGITNEIANNEGHRITDIFNVLLDDAKPKDHIIQKGKVTYVDSNPLSAFVGHNLTFDMNVIRSEMHRYGIYNELGTFPLLDTMLLGMHYCNFTNDNGLLKYPSLSELYRKLFAKSFSGAHNSLIDIQATYACFWEMIRQGIIQKKDYTFLLNNQEREELSEEYFKQAKGAQKMELLNKSAELGNAKAMYKLAQEYISSIEYVKAEKWLNKILISFDGIILDEKNIKIYKKTLKSLIEVNEKFLSLYIKYIIKGDAVIPQYKDSSTRTGMLISLQNYDVEKGMNQRNEYREKLKSAHVGSMISLPIDLIEFY